MGPGSVSWAMVLRTVAELIFWLRLRAISSDATGVADWRYSSTRTLSTVAARSLSISLPPAPLLAPPFEAREAIFGR